MILAKTLELRKINKTITRIEKKYDENPKATVRRARLMKTAAKLTKRGEILKEQITFLMGFRGGAYGR